MTLSSLPKTPHREEGYDGPYANVTRPNATGAGRLATWRSSADLALETGEVALARNVRFVSQAVANRPLRLAASETLRGGPSLLPGLPSAPQQSPGPPMRLLLVADLHYSLPQFDWVLDMAADFDVVILAGDHLDVASIVDGRAQSVVVRKYFNRLRAKTRLLSAPATTISIRRTRPARRWRGGSGERRTKASPPMANPSSSMTRFSPSAPGGTVPSCGRASARSLPTPPRGGPSAGSGSITRRLRIPISWGGARYFGDVELRAWIEQYRPDIVLSGHVHQSPFIPDGSWVDRIGPTWVFNAGQQPGALPTHIVIDTERGRGDVVLRGEPSIRPPRPAARAPRAAAGGRFRIGSESRIGFPFRTEREVLVLLVDQRFETSPTMPRWLPCPSNCRFRSTRWSRR